MPITSPVERISGPSVGSAPENRWNGSTAAFTLTWSGVDLLEVDRQPERGAAGRLDQSPRRSPWPRTAPSATPAGWPRSRTPREPCTANWTLISPRTPSASAIAAVCARISASSSLAQRQRRDHAGRVAGVHAGLLDVLHDRADPGPRAVADGVDVDLDRVLDEAVDQRAGLAPAATAARPRRSRCASRGRRARSSAAPAPGSRSRPAISHGVVDVAGDAPGRRLQPQLAEHAAEPLAILGDVDRLERRAQQRHALLLQPPRQPQRRLAAELGDHARAAARARSPRARPRPSAARSTGGRTSRRRSTPSPGCSSPSPRRSPGARSVWAACTQQ